MSRNIYGKINLVVENTLKNSGNRLPAEAGSPLPENFLLVLTLTSLYRNGLFTAGDAREIDTETVKKIAPPHLLRDFPIEGDFIISADDLNLLDQIIKKEGFTAAALIHEHFLGQGEEKSRKNSGTYYTPQWVASDIVNQSLIPLLNRKLSQFKKAADDCDSFTFIRLWDSLENFRILDPSCGWGIFLLESYQAFKSFYMKISDLARLITNNCAYDHFDLEDMFSGDYLDLVEENQMIAEMIEESKDPHERILNFHLFGVDLNSTSLKLASHFLNLKAKDTAGAACSLITDDFINFAMSKQKKFDLILGNPPYFTIGGGGRGKDKTEYHGLLKNHPLFGKHFRSQSDIFYYFIIGSIGLLKPEGILSFITPSYFLENEYADRLRSAMAAELQLEEIVNFAPCPVFKTGSGKKVGVDTLIFRGRKKAESKPSSTFPVYVTEERGGRVKSSASEEFLRAVRKGLEGPVRIEAPAILTGGRWSFSPYGEIMEKLIKDGRETFSLGDLTKADRLRYANEFSDDSVSRKGICLIGQGQETGLSEVFLIKREKAASLGIEEDLLKRNVKNRHVRRWLMEDTDEYVIMTQNEDDLETRPGLLNYLSEHHRVLEERQRVRVGARKWYAVSIPQSYELFERNPKIVVPYRADECRFAIDREASFNDGGDVRAIAVKDEYSDLFSCEYVLGILNSELILFWYSQAGKRKGKMFEFFTKPMSRIPIAKGTPEIRTEVENTVKEIERELKKGNGNTENIERRLNELVYELYKIPPAHRRIMEEALVRMGLREPSKVYSVD